ncbi:HEPN domain-containing protein [Heliobacterium chlorum]|uniref:HEPN domain-containing protein n=1 Tax=Heliobacterium chlorum TaxID=2698 RepID=A0ABR7T2T0_HELCL|nr:HEPN domain-containing protein [Heliobacterium chlorum]MBC9784512.1 HEPN domain-containing protein [Heliobacterium chlorum]
MNVPFDPSHDVLRWLQYAKEDLITAQHLSSREDLPPRTACFLAQQSGEKSLKALMTLFETPIRRSHKLDELVDLLPKDSRAKFEDIDIEWLTTWVTAGRYFGDWPEATKENAFKAIGIAESIYELTTEIIELRNCKKNS